MDYGQLADLAWKMDGAGLHAYGGPYWDDDYEDVYGDYNESHCHDYENKDPEDWDEEDYFWEDVFEHDHDD